MIHTVTTEIRGESDIINFIGLGEDFLVVRQIERRNGKYFMRAKRRML